MTGNLKDRSLKKDFSFFLSSFPFYFFLFFFEIIHCSYSDRRLKIYQYPSSYNLELVHIHTHTHTLTQTFTSHCYMNSLYIENPRLDTGTCTLDIFSLCTSGIFMTNPFAHSSACNECKSRVLEC